MLLELILIHIYEYMCKKGKIYGFIFELICFAICTMLFSWFIASAWYGWCTTGL